MPIKKGCGTLNVLIKIDKIKNIETYVSTKLNNLKRKKNYNEIKHTLHYTNYVYKQEQVLQLYQL